ncbi:MAG: glycoside hydrolase family 2, partial [Prevotella sp.]|nr:glycoside hydrolase family 2 [Prevotella sp.]
QQMAGQGDDATEFERLKSDIWHTDRHNVWTGSVAEGLQHFGVAPDFQSSVPCIRFVHRVDGERNIYWVRNFSGKEVDTDILLRDAKGTLTVMNPVTGKPVYGALKDGRLHLGADDALFVVADPHAAPVAEPTPLKPAGEIALSDPWMVSFEGQDAPEGIREWQTLSSLTESDEEAVKYFSGTVTYKNTFTLPKKNLPAGLSIDLGEVGQMADVFVNGEHVDFLWKAPYKVNFEGKLKPGKNTIEVKVVNTWANRLIGDGQPGVEGHSFTPIPFYGVKSLTQNMGTLIPAGLMGPVHLQILRYE